MRNFIYIIMCALFLCGCGKKKVYYLEEANNGVIAHLKPDCDKLKNGIALNAEEEFIDYTIKACGNCMNEKEIEYFFNLPNLNQERRKANKDKEIKDSIRQVKEEIEYWENCDTVVLE